MKKTIIAIIGIYLSINTLSAQTLTNIQVGEHVANCLRENYHPDVKDLQHLCRQACVFVKFNVSKQGIVTNIAFSNDSSSVVTGELYKAIQFLQYDKALIKTLKQSEKTVIQPFVYDYRVGCHLPPPNFKEMKDDEIRSYTVKVLKVFIQRENTRETLLAMLNFNKSDLQAIDCLLLKPYGESLIEFPY